MMHILPCAAAYWLTGRERRRQLPYLAESIRMHPDQDTLKAMMQMPDSKASTTTI